MAKSNHITPDTVRVAMPFPKLMHCLDKPTYLEMVVIGKEIYQNLATISSPFGTNHARYLGFMMPEVLHVHYFNDPFQPPINLDEYPNDIPANASAQRQSKLLIHHKVSKFVYDT